MNDYVAGFVEYLTQTKNYSANTATAYETDVRDFIKFYDNYIGATTTIADFARADAICFRAWMADRGRRELSHKSTARALSSLRGFYKFLAKKHNIENGAIGLISSPKVPRKLSKAINVTDVECVITPVTSFLTEKMTDFLLGKTVIISFFYKPPVFLVP